jgi:hypothetical protein
VCSLTIDGNFALGSRNLHLLAFGRSSEELKSGVVDVVSAYIVTRKMLQWREAK